LLSPEYEKSVDIRRDRLSTPWTIEVKNRRIGEDTRSEFERDVDRVKYNYYYRRLADVTQVSSGTGRILYHNRLTHSEKVSQVGRRLVQYLEQDKSNGAGIEQAGGIDRNVVTAAGLLHDTGHPPYGHIAEDQLDKIARAHRLPDGYEGNAQTLRTILSLTAHRKRESDSREPALGLDLTRAVVAACVKYPWSWKDKEAEAKHKWGYYVPEQRLFEEFVRPLLPPSGACLEAQIMDWADDITYAVHDLQDYYLDGIIPLHSLRHREEGQGTRVPVNNDEWREFWTFVTVRLQDTKGVTPSIDAERQFATYAVSFPTRPFRGERVEEADIGALASRIITDASKATSIRPDGSLQIDDKMRAVILALKEVTWYFVIDNSSLVSVQIAQRAKIDELFGRLYKWVDRSYKRADDARSADARWIILRRLPVRLNEFIDQLLKADHGNPIYSEKRQCYARAVIDYIASMTEQEFHATWLTLCAGEHYKESDSRYEHSD
jgi:dGTPase